MRAGIIIQQQRLVSSHSLGPQFLEWALNSWKVSVPLKNGQFEGAKKFCGPCQKKSM